MNDVQELKRRMQATLSYAEASERLRGCRRAVARAARALAEGRTSDGTDLEIWWQLERAHRAVVTRLRPAADAARAHHEPAPQNDAIVLELHAA